MSTMFASPAPRLYQPAAFQAILRDAVLNDDKAFAEFVEAAQAERVERQNRLNEREAFDPPTFDLNEFFERIAA